MYFALGTDEATHSRCSRRKAKSTSAKENARLGDQRQGQHFQGKLMKTACHYENHQETLQKCQNGLDLLASSFERVGNVFHWRVPFSSKVAIIALLVITLLLYLIPLRAIVLFWGFNKVISIQSPRSRNTLQFTKRLIKPNYEPNNELFDFLSRLPSKPEAEERSNHIIRSKPVLKGQSSNESAI